MYRIPIPKDDSIHLCPFETIKSTPKSLTLKYNAPRDCVLFTAKYRPLRFVSLCSPSKSCLKPVEYCTWLVTIVFVLLLLLLLLSTLLLLFLILLSSSLSIIFEISLISILLPSFAFTNLILSIILLSHGKLEEGNSNSFESTIPLSESICATMFIPSLVEWVRAISSLVSAPINLAQRSLVS